MPYEPLKWVTHDLHSQYQLHDGSPSVVEYRIGIDDFVDMKADVKWDGCIHLRRYFNGTHPDDPNFNEKDADYFHICDLDRFIADLQALREAIKKDFREGWPG